MSARPRTARRKPRLAVCKFASCDGCQLTILDCEDQLLELAGVVEIANFAEASRAVARGPYDLSLIEGSITTPHDAERIHAVRRASRVLVAIGTCACAGGPQALRNFADIGEWTAAVYPSPQLLETLRTSTPIADHVPVDFELQGCPPNKGQLLETIRSFLDGHRPALPTHTVCMECKRTGTPCVIVARGVACLGPVTRNGCGVLCPPRGRGCYGCFGPVRGALTPQMDRLLRAQGLDEGAMTRAYRNVYNSAPAFRNAGDEHERRRS